jgi:hypothetical protein
MSTNSPRKIPAKRTPASALPGGLARAQVGQWAAEHQPELGGMRGRPAAELAADREQTRTRVVRRAPVPGLLDRVARLVVQIRAEVADQLLQVGVVAVQRGRRHAHLARDGAQRNAARTVLDQQLSRHALDLAQRGGPQAFPATGYGCH